MVTSFEESASISIEGTILETSAAVALKAVDRSRGEPVCVWRYRTPFGDVDVAQSAFQLRLDALSKISRGILFPQSCGIDPEGYGFVISPIWQGDPVATFGSNRSASEAERRFMGMLQVLDRMHRAGLTCGDLCHNSFFVTRSGEALLVAVLGVGPTVGTDLPASPEAEQLARFRAPEQQQGGAPQQASDVYALGMLGYLLFTGSCPELPADGRGIPAPLSALIVNAPEWADPILIRCLASDPTQRFSSATELLAALIQLRTEQDAQRSLPVKRWSATDAKKSAPQVAAFPPRLGSKGPQPQLDGPESPPATDTAATPRPRALSISALVILCVITIGSLIWGVTVFSLRREEQSKEQSALSTLTSAAGSDAVREAIVAINDKTGGTDRQQYLDRLTASDDPLAHDALVRSALAAPSPELRTLSEKAVLERGRRFGLIRTGEQVREWLRGIPWGATSPQYQPMMQLLDATLPLGARQDAVRQLFAENRDLAQKLAAALALDTQDAGSWQGLLSELVLGEEQAGAPGKVAQSTLALILGEPTLALVFGDDIIQRRDQLTDDDVRWLLRRLAERNDPLVRTLAHLALERGILPPIRTVALALLRDRTDLPTEITEAISRIAAGVTGTSDIAALGRWYDLAGEQLLLALAADELAPDLQADLFDTIAGKSLSDPAVSSLVQWIRSRHWDSRARYSKVVGVLANATILPESQIVEALKALSLTKADADVLDALLAAPNPLLAKLVVENLGENLGLQGLLRLLDHPEPAVRIAAIRRLGSVNDVTLLRTVIDRYESERDATVREAYKSSFWVIQQRTQ